MNGLAAAVATVAALGALIFAWLTLREARFTRREEAHERELARLYHLVDLVGRVAEAGRSEQWSQTLGIAQLQLLAALTGYPNLVACMKLTDVEAEDAFDAFLVARDELEDAIKSRIERRTTTTPT